MSVGDSKGDPYVTHSDRIRQAASDVLSRNLLWGITEGGRRYVVVTEEIGQVL